MITQTAPASQSGETRQKILDAAELLFIEHGFSATSLRAIAARAEVNLAATHYHFGSKKGLLAAVCHRRIGPLNAQRLLALELLQQSGGGLTVRKILEAFFQPFTHSDLHAAIPALVGRLYGEPEALTKPLLEEEFSEVANAFQAALAAILPDVDRDELKWRFHFMIGSMIHLMQLSTPLGIESSRESFPGGLERLINFSIAGFKQAEAGKHDD